MAKVSPEQAEDLWEFVKENEYGKKEVEAAFRSPEYLSTLIISDGLSVSFTKHKPNWWRRLWYWLLLGWKWVDFE
jgi:hypothetical protein